MKKEIVIIKDSYIGRKLESILHEIGLSLDDIVIYEKPDDYVMSPRVMFHFTIEPINELPDENT